MRDSKTETRFDADLVQKRHVYRAYTIFVVIFMCVGSASFGYASSIIGTTLGQPSFIAYMGLDTATNAKALISVMVSLYFVGGIGGAFCHAWVSNTYGRKWSIAIGNVIILISGALCTASVNPAMFIAFRFTTGWGAIQTLCGVPLWISEIVLPRDRGMMVDIHAVFLNFGYTIAGYMGVAFYYYSGTNQWRGPMGLTMLFPTILLAGIYWMPESPRYLLSTGRCKEAWAIVHHLHSSPNDPNDEFAKREFYQMRKQIELDIMQKTSYAEIFRRPSYRKRAIITIYYMFSLVSSGVLVINSYGSIIYSRLGYKPAQVLQLQAGWTACGCVMCIVAMAFADRISRPRLISAGFGLCSACLIAVAVLQKYYLETTDKSGLSAAAAMLFIFIFFYALTIEGASYFYIAEIWPTHLRAQGFTLLISTLCIVNIAWTEAAPYAFDSMGWKFYIFFFIFAALACAVSGLLFPDTLHMPLEEVAVLFGDDDQVAVLQSALAVSSLPYDPVQDTSMEEGAVPTIKKTD